LLWATIRRRARREPRSVFPGVICEPHKTLIVTQLTVGKVDGGSYTTSEAKALEKRRREDRGLPKPLRIGLWNMERALL